MRILAHMMTNGIKPLTIMDFFISMTLQNTYLSPEMAISQDL